MSENITEPQLAVVILAAGQGTRMKSSLPKVLHRIGGRPLLGHVLHTARALHPQSVLVVVRHERDTGRPMPCSASHPRSSSSTRTRSPAPGRAVEVALAQVPDFAGDVLVLSGDVPLLDDDTLARLIRTHRESGAAATVLSAVVDDATGYGRVIRDDAGGGAADRRAEGCDGRTRHPSPRSTRASTSSRPPPLRAHISLVGTANAQGERYLTDVVALLRDSRLAVSRDAGDGCRGRAGRERPRAAVRGRAHPQRADGASLAARRSDDPRPGHHLDRRRRDSRARCHRAAEHPHPAFDGHRRGRDGRARHEPRRLRGRRERRRHPHRRHARRDRRGSNGRTVRLPAPGHLPRRQGQDRHVRRDEELDDRRAQQGAAPLVHRRHDDRARA